MKKGLSRKCKNGPQVQKWALPSPIGSYRLVPVMSFAEIEAELEKLTAAQLSQLALKSWTVYVEKEGRQETAHECSEEDPRLLAALDEAVAKADFNPGQGHSGQIVRARLSEWITK
jgi:hypothetical protein